MRIFYHDNTCCQVLDVDAPGAVRPMTEEWDGKTERRRQDSYQLEILTKITSLSVELNKVVRFIEGNGNPSQGAIVRLDRLEQQGEARQRHIGWMWGTIGGLGVKAVWDFLTKSR